MASSLDRIKKRRQQLEIEKSNLSSDEKSLSQISLLRDEISRTGKIDYGDLGDFAPIKSRTKVDDIAPVTPLTSKGNDEYSSMSSRELWDKQQSLIKQANEYSSNTTGDDWKSIKGIWNLFSGKTANKLKEDKEYQKLQEEIAKVSKAYENKLVEEKKYDKNVMGGIEKGVDTFVGNAQTGVKGIESSFQKILGKKPDKNSTEAGLQEKFAQKARQETTGAGGIALDVLGSIGRMTPQLLIGNPIASTAMGFANYGGGAYNQAIQEGYDDDKATKYGLAIGTMEMAMTKALGAFGDIYGKTKLGNASQDVIDKLIPKIISNKQVRNVLSQFVSEGTEEFLQEYTENIAKDVLLDEKGLLKSTWKNITDTDVLSDALYSGLVGGITGSTIAIPGQVDAYRYEKRTGRNAETGLTTNEQSVMNSVIKNKTIEKQKQAALDTEVNKIIAEQEKTFGKLTEAEKTGIKKQVQSQLDSGKIDYTTSKLSKKEITEIEKQVREDLEKGYISTDIIESTLGGEEYQNYKNTQDRVDKIKNEIKKLESQNYSKLTVGEWNSTIERLNSLKEELKTIDINTLKSNLEAKMSGLINSNELLQRSYQEKSNRGVQFQADINKYTGKQRETIQKAIDSGILNNTNKTHDFVDMVAKLSADKGVSFDFANNAKLKESGFAVDGKRVNGFVTQNGITINIDSNNALNSVVGHEITHVLEGTELYTELQKAVKEYATSKGVYDTKLTELTELYKGIKDVNVENELTSDLVGEYLFTDADFVKNLSVTKPNVFQKIYNEIKYLLKIATAGSKEARQLEKVKKTFEEAYRNSQSNTTSDTQYSISEATKQDNQGRTLTKEQQTYFKDSKLRDENGDLEVVYHSTPNQFTVFDNSMSGENTGYDNTGFGTFVTTNRAFSERFKDIDGTGKQGYTMELFANVTKPITHPYKAGIKYGDEQASKIVEDYYKAIGETEALDEMQEMIEYEEADSLYDAYMNIVQMDSSGIYENANDERMRLEDAGYDAVEIIEGYESELVEGSTSDEVVSSYAIFNSNQLKNIDNTKPTSDEDIRYSLTRASMEQVEQAVKLEKQNKTPEEIYLETGAYRGAEGLWRTEIDDSKATIKISSTIVGGKYKLKDILEFPKLYKAYPEFKEMTVIFDDNMLPSDLGKYNPETNTLTINSSLYDYKQAELLSAKKQLADLDNTVKTYEVLFSGEQIEKHLEGLKDKAKKYKRKDYQKNLKSTLLHELQHVIQEKEGLSSGASPSYWREKQLITEQYRNAYIERENELYKKMNMDKFFNGMLGKVQDMTWEEFKQAKEDFIDNSEYGQQYRDLQELMEKNKKRYEILTGRSAYELYRDTAGEEEAREVQKRMDLSSKDRKKFIPYVSRPETVFYEGFENEKKYGVMFNKTDDIRYSLSKNVPLEERVNGDVLLDAQDLIDEIKSVGGEVDENGYVTVYHQTSDENAQKIKETGKMISKEQAIFFSTSKNAQQAEGRGKTKLEFKIPAEKLVLDDIFSDNADVKIPLNGEKNIDVSDYLVKNDTKYSLSNEGLNKIANDFGGGKNYWEANLYDKDLDGAKYYLKHQDSVKDKFKELNNIKVEPVYKNIELRTIGSKDENVQKFIKDNNLNVIDLANNQQLLDEFYKLEHEAIKKQLNVDDNEANEIFNQWKDYFEKQKGINEVIWPLIRFEKDFKNIIEGNTTEIDNIETAKLERQLVDDNPEFEKYVSKYVEKLFNEKIEYDANDVMEEAKYQHGTTNNFEVGAYMTTDGSLLDFNDGGFRDDHRTISVFDLNMKEFMDYGAIRMQPETPGFEMQVEPTNEQYNKLYDYIDYIKSTRNSDDKINIDIDKSNSYDCATYSMNTPTSKIINDVKTYWKTGSFPKKSEFADFYYSLSKNDIAPTKQSGNVYGEDVKLEQIAPLQESVDNLTQKVNDIANKMDKQVIGEPVTEIDLPMIEQQREEEFRNIEYNNEPDTTYNDETVEIKIKSKKDIVNNIKENFNITAKEANALYNKIAGQPDITLEDIAAELSNYSDFKTEYTDPNVKELKRIIRNTKIDMSYLKNQITDYNNFRKSNMGKLRLGNNGTQIDTFYEELSNMYPAYLDPKIITEADQLEALSNFMNNDYNLVDEYTIDNETINNLANQIYTEIGNTERYNASEQQYKQTKKQLKNLTPPVEEASNKIDVNEIEPIRNDEIAPIYNDPTKERTYDEIAEILETEPKKEDTRNKRKWAIFKASVLDKGSVFEDLSLKAKNRELMGKWDYTLTSQSRAQNVIGEGHVEFDEATKTYKQTSKSLNDIRAEVDNTGLTKDFYNYIYHKHNVDRMNLEERFEDGVNKPVFGEGITSEISQQIVDEYEAAHPEFMDYAKDVYDYVNADRQQLVKEGVISQETADLWQEMYPHYVPIRRSGKDGIDINVPLDTRRTGINAPIKKAVGGSADILPLFDTMAMRTLQTYRATAKNSFGIELMNTLNTNTETGNVNVDEVIDSIDNQEGLLQEGKNGKNPTFTVFQNGEKVTYDITQDMYDALKPVSDSSFLSKTIKPLNAISNFHRGILTQYNLFFALTNAVKDAQDVLINSQHAAKTYATVPEAIAQMSTKGYWYQEYMKNGGEQNSYFDSQNNTFNPEKKGLYKLNDMFPLKAISSINDVIEMTPRLAEYIASRKAGRSIEVSMLDAARVTTNFKAGGDFTKFLNRNGANFLNASVQGFNQQVRNIREANANGLKGWASLATKFAVAGLPALLLNALLWDDDDDYEELSDYVKQNYYIVAKYGDGQFIRIPKGRTLAVIQNAMEQVQKASKGDDEADLQEFISLFLNNLAPNNPIENNVLSPIIQAATNKAWYGGDLVPTRLQNMPAAEQYDESTDSFSKWLGEKLNISPYKINYVMNQYTGFLGDMFMPMMTPEAKNDADSVGDYLIAPLKDKFTTDSVMKNQNTSELFETSEELTTNAKKSNATDEDVLRNKFVNSMKGEMNELYKQKREIQNSDLSKSEKYKQVREIQKEINELSKYALNNYKDVNITGNYASVGNREYRFTTNSEGEKAWNKITDKQKAKQEEVSNALGINASDYWNNKEEYDYAYDSPANYGISKTIGGYEAFKTYLKELSDIKSDKDSSGKTISGSRKQKVFDYINSSNLEFEQKIILAKMEYPSYDEYNYEIIDYLNNNNDISYEEEVEILKKLGFEVDSYGNISW